jgi:hypothetical protein
MTVAMHGFVAFSAKHRKTCERFQKIEETSHRILGLALGSAGGSVVPAIREENVAPGDWNISLHGVKTNGLSK